MKKLIPALLIAACGAAMAADNAQLDKKDRSFMEKAAAGGMLEVEAGKMAESKAQNADVKSFGSMLNTDHSAANQELMSLAQKKGVALPTALPKKDQKKLDKMAKAKDFDKTFIHEQGIEDHKHDIKDFEKASKDAKDPDVKAFAAKTLPTLQKHLQRAQEIDKSMKGKKA
jgi:putative membrane protein